MLPSRITNVSAKYQRALKKAIKHSRIIALLPFVYTSK
jgi:ribosomal protein S18